MPDYRISLLFFFMFALLIPGDISRYAYQVPELSKLEVVEGRVEHSVETRRGRSFIFIDENNDKTFLRCHLTRTRSIYCPPFNSETEKAYFSGKKVVITYDLASRLIFELSHNGKKLLNYQTQKKKYEAQQKRHIPLGTIVSLLFLLLVYFDFASK